MAQKPFKTDQLASLEQLEELWQQAKAQNNIEGGN